VNVQNLEIICTTTVNVQNHNFNQIWVRIPT
jgi:hypothetical protein